MDRPKRTTRKPVRLIDEATPVKRAKRVTKENVDPNKKGKRPGKKTDKPTTTVVPAIEIDKEVVVVVDDIVAPKVSTLNPLAESFIPQSLRKSL